MHSSIIQKDNQTNLSKSNTRESLSNKLQQKKKKKMRKANGQVSIFNQNKICLFIDLSNYLCMCIKNSFLKNYWNINKGNLSVEQPDT